MKKVFSFLLLAAGMLFAFQGHSITVNISGNVTNISNGAPVANHAVTISSDSLIGFYYYNTVQTDANGFYTESIPNVNPNDSVYFYVQTLDCNNVWHYQTVSGNSTPITVNFQICVGTPPPLITVTISGYVYEAGTVIPVDNHAVTIAADSTGGFYYYNTVYTNASGFYTVTISNVPNNTNFTVSTLDCNNNTQSQTVNGNNTPITVTFYICVGPPPPTGYMWGHVFTGSAFADHAKVDLIFADSLVIIGSYYINDSAGLYSFTNVAPGNYYLAAELLESSALYGQYAPTYYIASLYWTGATLIQQGGTSDQYDIHLIPTPGYAPGNGNINGNVQQNLKSTASTPVPDMEVLLLDQGNQPLAFTKTDANGEFGFTNIAFGTYVVFPQKLAVNTSPATVTLNANNPNANLFFVLDNGNVFLGINDHFPSFIDHITEICPNPVSGTASIKISVTCDSHVMISVSNVAGQVLREWPVALMPGMNQVNIDASSLQAGHYFLSILSSDGRVAVRKFIVK
jgi:hypothetical protein